MRAKSRPPRHGKGAADPCLATYVALLSGDPHYRWRELDRTRMGLRGGRRGRHAQPSDSTFLAAAATGRGQVCVLLGPSGEGKSRLLGKCPESAEALGMS